MPCTTGWFRHPTCSLWSLGPQLTLDLGPDYKDVFVTPVSSHGLPPCWPFKWNQTTGDNDLLASSRHNLQLLHWSKICFWRETSVRL